MRYQFGPDLEYALRVRGLDMGMVATLAEVSPGTVSSAVRGRPLNLKTATRIAKVVGRHPVIDELERWNAESPRSEQG